MGQEGKPFSQEDIRRTEVVLPVLTKNSQNVGEIPLCIEQKNLLGSQLLPVLLHDAQEIIYISDRFHVSVSIRVGPSDQQLSQKVFNLDPKGGKIGIVVIPN